MLQVFVMKTERDTLKPVLLDTVTLKNTKNRRKVVKIRNRYSQEPHLTQDTTWESDKNTINITNESQEVSPFPASDHKAAPNRREYMTNNTNDPQKKYCQLPLYAIGAFCNTVDLH